jgi:hypothetical protein
MTLSFFGDWWYIHDGKVYWQWRYGYEKALRNLLTALANYNAENKKEAIADAKGYLKYRKTPQLQYNGFKDVIWDQLSFCCAKQTLRHYDKNKIKHIRELQHSCELWLEELHHPRLICHEDGIPYTPEETKHHPHIIIPNMQSR